jgi:hypothetical protein
VVHLSRFALVALVACGSSPPAQHGPTPPSNGSAGPVATMPPAGSAAGSGAPPAIAVKDIGCPSPTCAYHAGANGYFTCLAGGAGACFHFGAPCTPTAGCMYNATEHAYRTCTNPVEGQCQQWGAACAPASLCMFDPDDGNHHHCDEVAGGTCKRFGALCAP